MNAYHANLCRTLDVPAESMETLIRASRTLHRWFELECGDSNDYASWAIERDEETGKPYRSVHPHNAAYPPFRVWVSDREKGARARIAKVCAALGLHYYIQGDPRGAALWISRTRIDADRYTDAAPVGV